MIAKPAHLAENLEIAAEPPMKLSSILTPVDFSDGSKKALQYAVHFARQFGSRLILLHVLPSASAAGAELVLVDGKPLPEKELENQAALRLKAWAREFVPNEIVTQIQVCRGIEAIEIVNAAKRTQTGLMVISTHGRTGRAHTLAGSLAENLVQLAPCPVLVVREHERDFIEITAAKENMDGAPNFIGMAI